MIKHYGIICTVCKDIPAYETEMQETHHNYWYTVPKGYIKHISTNNNQYLTFTYPVGRHILSYNKKGNKSNYWKCSRLMDVSDSYSVTL